MKKIKISSRLFYILATALFITVVNLVVNFVVAVDQYEVYLNTKYEKMDLIADELHLLLHMNANVSFLEKRLQMGYRLDEVDFYEVRDNNKVLFSSNTENDPRFLENIKRGVSDEQITTYEYNQLVYSTGTISNINFVVGFKKDLNTYASYYGKDNRGFLISGIVFVVVFISALFAFATRDFRRVLRVLSGRGKREFSEVNARFAEGELLTRSLGGYELEVSRQKKETHAYRELLNESVLEAFHSGQNHFRATMVRVDINNYSKHLKKFGRDEVLPVFDRFLDDCRSIVQNHGGLSDEEAGDELIFYMKVSGADTGSAGSVNQALSCLRQIIELAETVHHDFKPKFDADFFIKSSLSLGDLSVSRHDSHIRIGGLPYIETVRLLSEVSDRHKNVVYMGQKVKDLCRVAQLEFVGNRVLKGVSDEYAVYEVNSFRSLPELLSNLDFDSAEFLKGYRTPVEQRQILTHIKNNRRNYNQDTLLRVFASLKSYNTSSVTKETSLAYLEVLSDLLQEESSQNDHSGFLLSSFVSLGSGFLGPRFVANEAQKLLRNLLSHNNARVVANSIELLGSLGEGGRQILSEVDLDDSNNRVIANEIFVRAKAEITPSLVKGVKMLMGHKQPVFVSSGIFVLNEIVEYYIREDFVYLKTKMDLGEMLRLSSEFLSHEHEAIRRQATRAVTTMRQIEADVA